MGCANGAENGLGGLNSKNQQTMKESWKQVETLWFW